MATGVVATGRKLYSEVVKGVGAFAADAGVNVNFARVDCEGSTTIEPMGIPMTWVNGNSAFEVFIAQTISATGSPLPDVSPVCIVVGAKEGKGFNKEDVTLSGTSQELTVLYRGQAAIAESAIDFGAASAPNIALFKAQLEKQGIVVVADATTADPSFVA